MHRPSPLIFRLRSAAFGALALAGSAAADHRVAVTARANPEYTAHKFGDGKAMVETYVMMQGRYFQGHTVDRSIDRMPFRHIAEYLGMELSRQNYLPARSITEAQLLIVVHWGTTTPRVSTQEASGQTSLTTDLRGENSIHADARANPTGDAGSLPPPPDNNRGPEPNDLVKVGDRLFGTMSQGNGALLLGYNNEMHRLGKNMMSGTKEATIKAHLAQDRYFITLIAYDMQEVIDPGRSRRQLWSVHLNISSPGNNFDSALNRISTVAVSFAGRTTDGMETIRTTERHGRVTLAPLTIIGETSGDAAHKAEPGKARK